MRRYKVVAIGAAMCLAVLIAACGDDATEPTPTPAPTLTAVSPDQGSALGGTQSRTNAVTIRATRSWYGAS